MFGAALPFWSANGVDREHGGFVEDLPFGGGEPADFKRTRVACRQIYVFAHASLLGWSEGDDLVRHGLSYLTEKAWNGPDAGFARSLTREGGRFDPTPDLYDHAFALFAFAWAYRATQENDCLDWAHKTLDFIEQVFREPDGEGFWHASPARGWRLQNPHMHLLEASLAAFEASGQGRFADLACELAALFRARFYDPETKTLGEFYDDDWTRAPAPDGLRIEPGHQFEWVWILQKCNRLLGLNLGEEARGLAAFAEHYGVNERTGAVFNAVAADGAPLDRGSRTWPNTERIKAAVALFEMEGIDPADIFESSGGLLFDRYFNTEPAGAYIDAFDENGAPTADRIPASTLYHLFLAFAEMLRIEERAAPAP